LSYLLIDISRCLYDNYCMEKKRERGRPKLDRVRIMRSIRVYEDEWQAWAEAAGDRGVSELIRDTVNRSIARKRTKG
jgi:hypothetical protein